MARRNSRKSKKAQVDPATRNFTLGSNALYSHPLFAPLWFRAHIYRSEYSRCPDDGWAIVTANGEIHVHPTKRGEPQEWMFVLAHCLLHLGLDHFQTKPNQRAWSAACDCVVTRFLLDLKFATMPTDMRLTHDVPIGNESTLYGRFCESGLPLGIELLGTAGSKQDMIVEPMRAPNSWALTQPSFPVCLQTGIAEAVTQAVEVAAGNLEHMTSHASKRSNAQIARGWFISNYPLLGALAEAFNLVEDARICQRLGVSVAAIDIEGKEIYVNPAAALSMEEARFVIAHELLHAGLRHDVRRRGRDPFLWNVACDYVINDWLVQMGVGDIPAFGGLHDVELKGLSAESIYDRIATDLRKYRKLATLAGVGQCDLIAPRTPDWWTHQAGMSLDDFYRGCLARGLLYHDQYSRGFLPSGLVEEIRALQQPVIPWDVELAQWFDNHFAPIERRRTYARPSRRQAATPDIPRPRWHVAEGADDGRTFAVVIDTSGSMDRKLLGKALGAVASYAVSHDVPAVRVVFCDAAAYDQGFMSPDAIADRVRVRGRGGTVLQPAITIIEKAKDFPRNGPILVITDGWCDRLRIRREHAFLLPEGATLPFSPQGPVFRMR